MHLRSTFNKGSTTQKRTDESKEKIAKLERKVVQLTIDNEFLKKTTILYELRRETIEKSGKITIRRQCELLGINRSSLFYKKKMPTRSKDIFIVNH